MRGRGMRALPRARMPCPAVQDLRARRGSATAAACWACMQQASGPACSMRALGHRRSMLGMHASQHAGHACHASAVQQLGGDRVVWLWHSVKPSSHPAHSQSQLPVSDRRKKNVSDLTLAASRSARFRLRRLPSLSRYRIAAFVHGERREPSIIYRKRPEGAQGRREKQTERHDADCLLL